MISKQNNEQYPVHMSLEFVDTMRRRIYLDHITIHVKGYNNLKKIRAKIVKTFKTEYENAQNNNKKETYPKKMYVRTHKI